MLSWLEIPTELFPEKKYEPKIYRYEYNLVWSDHYIDSSKFKRQNYHTNLRSTMNSKLFVSKSVSMGIFKINMNSLIEGLDSRS